MTDVGVADDQAGSAKGMMEGKKQGHLCKTEARPGAQRAFQ